MSKAKNIQTDLVLRLTLDFIQPQIWREVAIERNTTLDMLHEIIQSLFMWDDSHLHQFTAKGTIYGCSEYLEDDDVVEESDTEIAAVLSKRGDKIKYEYDFGDGWSIEIKVVDKWDEEKSGFYQLPVCLSGERAAPPEDCGGVPGYYELVEAVKNPTSEDGAERLEWLGRPWNPETFDTNAANYILGMDIAEFQISESEAILEDYSALIVEQLEHKTYSFVNDTMDRLLNQGIDRDEALTLITLAFMRERSVSNGAEKIDEVQYSKTLSELPSMPWLEPYQ